MLQSEWLTGVDSSSDSNVNYHAVYVIKLIAVHKAHQLSIIINHITNVTDIENFVFVVFFLFTEPQSVPAVPQRMLGQGRNV